MLAKRDGNPSYGRFQQGLVEGRCAVLSQIITRRFGPLPEWAEIRLEQASSQQLNHWAREIFTAGSLDELFGG